MKVIAAGVQMRAEPANVHSNLARAEVHARCAINKGAQIVLFPELFNIGYFIDRRLFDVWETVDGRTVTWMRELAVGTGAIIAGSFGERRGNCLYNTLAIADSDGRVQFYAKRHPTKLEAAAFESGEDSNLIQTSLGPIGTVVCADIEWARELIGPLSGSAALLLYPQASNAPRRVGRWLHHRELRSGRPMFADTVAALSTPAIYAGLIGHVQSTTRILTSWLIGGTWIVDSNGHALAHVPYDEEGCAVSEVTLTRSGRQHRGFTNPGRLGNSLMDWLVRRAPDLRPASPEATGRR